MTEISTSSPAVSRYIDSTSGTERTFTVVGPRDAAPGRVPVLVLHGSKQTGDGHRAFIGRALDPIAADGRAVVAYLDGYRGNWNDARKQSSFPARAAGIDDVSFVRAVLQRLASDYGVDPAKAVVVGYSNGGQMVLRLLHETPELVAAAAIVAATMPAPGSFLAPDPEPAARPLPVVLVHGTRDRIVPFAGGAMSALTRAVFKVGGETLSAPDTAAYLARRNGITTDATTSTLPHDGKAGRGTAVRRIEYRQEGRPSVTLFAVEGGGHTVPGPTAGPRIIGRTTADISIAGIVENLLNQVASA